MSRPTPSRRSLLRALGPTGAVAVAGCGGLDGSLGSGFDGGNGQDGNCDAVDVEPPDPVPMTVTATGEDVGLDVGLRVQNRSDTAHEVTVTARPEGVYRNVFEQTVAVGRNQYGPWGLGEESLSDAGPEPTS